MPLCHRLLRCIAEHGPSSVGTVRFVGGERVRIPTMGIHQWVNVVEAVGTDAGWRLFLADDTGSLLPRPVLVNDVGAIEIIEQDGGGDSARGIAALWALWMSASGSAESSSTLLASTPLTPYAHQSNAVYGAMLPQPQLRFLLADEPGTGKTIMAGLYLREAQKLGLVRRALVVAPAGLVTKWQYDFERFFGGELRRVTAESVHQHALDVNHDAWVVSLELAASNGNVQHAIRPDRAGWDLAIFDEAHRLSPLAGTFYSVGRMLASSTPRALLMTATPHRGSEWLFRHLLHLVDPEIYPDPGDDERAELPPLKPGSIHFLRRMKEDLFDRDGVTPLFRGRTASNIRAELSSLEDAVYRRSLEIVDEFFPTSARPLARMVYGKRAASSLHALGQTLRRRKLHMGDLSATEAEFAADPAGEDDSLRQEAQVVHAESLSSRKERSALADLIAEIDAVLANGYVASKWDALINRCLLANGIDPGGLEQAVIFTEYADSAEWVVQELRRFGFTAQMYSGRQQHLERDAVRAAFMRGEFQVIVSTDAGNEGIDLQSAHVLINYDIPWSLVRLEQRMGRIHRIGQRRQVSLYNLVAIGTREGETLHKLLERFVSAANDLDGQMFDSLSLVAGMVGVHYSEWLSAFFADDPRRRIEAVAAVEKVQAEDLKRAAESAKADELALATKVDSLAALQQLQRDLLERINPAIVEAFLLRAAESGILTVEKTATGEGIYRLGGTLDLPRELEANGGLIATSGEALRRASLETDASRVLALGPGEPVFGALIEQIIQEFAADMYRGTCALDPTSVSDYSLFVFESELKEGISDKTTRWLVLVRVDESGVARTVRWEALANMVAFPSGIPQAMHPARTHAARSAAEFEASTLRTRLTQARKEWFSTAQSDLQSMPVNLTKRISNREERLRIRNQLSDRVRRRIERIEAMTDVRMSDLKLRTHVSVRASGVPLTPKEKDSELIAMIRVRDILRSDGWAVTDVSSEGRGYDLLATRGGQQRCVEVKGIWDSAGSRGLRLTSNEVLIALQQGDQYWLYVVDTCADGVGTLFGAFSNPVRTFGPKLGADSIFSVPGSALTDARITGLR